MAFLIGGANSAAADDAYSIANSCRFNYADSAYLTRTFGSAGNRRTWTFSTWCKRSKFGAQQTLFGTSSASGTYHLFYWGSDETLSHNFSGANVSTGKFRDPSAWYHVVCAVDTTQGTAANRVKLYVNGVQSGTGTYPDEDAEMILNDAVRCDVGSSGAHYTSHMCGHYLAETVFIDGTQYAASDFGEFDEDSPTIWKPKDVSGLTFGTNGFYLDYEASDNLGNDANGGTDLTETNLAAADQATDTPTNNFCTWNPLEAYYYNGTFSEGNVQTITAASEYGYLPATIGMSAGKWYCEIEYDAKSGGGGAGQIGITSSQASSATNQLGVNVADYGWYGPDGVVYNDTGGEDNSTQLNTFTEGDIIGIYLDLDNNKLYFAKNGTLENSGTGISITAPASTPIGAYFFAIGYPSSSYTGTYKANFGGCPAFAISSGNTDANGYGNFEYDPSAGTFDSASKDFLALCTKNLGSDGG